MYVQDSWSHGDVPVLTYYMLLQSSPKGGDEAQTDLAHLRDPQLMRRTGTTCACSSSASRARSRSSSTSSPISGATSSRRTRRRSRRRSRSSGSRFANQLAPNVLLAYHMSGWGTKHDIVYEDPADATVRAYAAQSARVLPRVAREVRPLVRGLLRSRRRLLREEQGNPKTWFTPADFHRHLLYGATFVKLDAAADGRLADPARQHLSLERHVGPLPRQPRRVAARRREPRAPARVRHAPATSASSSAAAPTDDVRAHDRRRLLLSQARRALLPAGAR